MQLYAPDPNPPCKPKECQSCGVMVDGENIEGWWLERENWQNPNTQILFCKSCCFEKMNEWSNYSGISDEHDVIAELTDERIASPTSTPKELFSESKGGTEQ